MKDTLANLIVAAVSFLFGAAVTRWWNRARPLVLLRGFTDILKFRDDIIYDAALADLTEQLWEVPNLEKGEVNLGDIQRVRKGVNLVREYYGEGLAAIDEFEDSMKNAATDDQIIECLHKHITKASMELPLNLALRRGDIRVSYVPPPGVQQKLPIHESEDCEDGCYVLVWKGSTSTFATGLKGQAYLKPRLEPFIQALRHLDKPTILDVLRKLKPLLEKQTRIADKIHPLLESIMEDSGRWACRLLVANYGAAPMMVWPDAKMVIRHKSSHARIPVPSYTAFEADTSPKVRDIDGVHVLPPGEKIWIWAITRNIQKDIPDGKLLRTHYTQKDSMAYVQLTILRRGAFFGKSIKSNAIIFGEGDVEMP